MCQSALPAQRHHFRSSPAAVGCSQEGTEALSVSQLQSHRSLSTVHCEAPWAFQSSPEWGTTHLLGVCTEEIGGILSITGWFEAAKGRGHPEVPSLLARAGIKAVSRLPCKYAQILTSRRGRGVQSQRSPPRPWCYQIEELLVCVFSDSYSSDVRIKFYLSQCSAIRANNSCLMQSTVGQALCMTLYLEHPVVSQGWCYENTDARLSWARSLLHLWLWATFFTHLNLNCLTCNMEINMLQGGGEL